MIETTHSSAGDYQGHEHLKAISINTRPQENDPKYQQAHSTVLAPNQEINIYSLLANRPSNRQSGEKTS